MRASTPLSQWGLSEEHTLAVNLYLHYTCIHNTIHLIEKTQECGNVNKLYPSAPSQYYYRYHMYVFA